MAKLYTNQHGQIAIDFVYPGLDRVRFSLGVKDTKENLAWAKKTHLDPLKKEISAENLQAIVKRFGNKCERLQRLAATQTAGWVGKTIDDLLDMVQQDYDKNQRSNAPRFKSTVKHVRQYFRRKLATELTGDDLDLYGTQRLEEGASRGTINRELSAIRRGFKLARLKWSGFKARPEFVMFRENNARKGFFTEEEVQALLKYLPDYLHPYVKIAYITGWRKSELLSRQWRHVSERYLRLEEGETKNGKGRDFPLDFPGLREVFNELELRRRQELAEGRIIPWLFHRDGQQIQGFRKAWDNAMEKAVAVGEIAERRLVHDFRRSAVSNIDHLGLSRMAIKQLTGHLTDAVFDRYSMTPKPVLDWVAREAQRAIDEGRGGELLGGRSVK